MKGNNFYHIFIITIVFSLLVLSSSAQITITEFNDSLDSINFSYPLAYITHEYFVRLPEGTVAEARMRIQGLDILGQAILPADVVLVTDVSGSMRDYNKMDDAIAADQSFLDNVNLNYIHVGLVHYSNWRPETSGELNTDLDIHLSDDRGALEDEIDDYYADGYTNMGGGMEYAMNEILGSYAQETNRTFMLVMTDGRANCYPLDINDYDLTDPSTGYCPYGLRRIPDTVYAQGADYARHVANLCAENNITIFAIAFGRDANTGLMQDIATITGGEYHFAPDGDTLQDIYNQIAQSISYQDFPTPKIESTSPVSMDGWEYPTQYSLDTVWDAADCGSGSARCIDYRAFIQANIDSCSAYPCDVMFSAYSETFGQLTLSELYIEINEPPIGNLPPNGNCREENMFCGDTEVTINIDDGSMISDPNDELNTLTWTYDYSLQSPGGSHFLVNSDFNTTRQFIVTVDPSFMDQTFWEVFFFNVSDPSGASTMSCVNVSYEGCIFDGCGDGDLDSGEECDDGNDGNNNDECIIDYLVPYECMNATCGDGYIWNVNCSALCEQCDNGSLNNDTLADACRTNCTLPYCGDSVNDTGEECDDGANGIDTDFCNDTCALTFCGDGIRQIPNGRRRGGLLDNGVEQCDDGNTNETDDCFSNCTITTYCGNGNREGSEDCDDWPDMDFNDECIMDTGYECMNASCGDGYIWNVNCSSSCEECDNTTALNSNSPNACRVNCTNPICGDNIRDDLPPNNEECDDTSSPYCDAACQYTTICGDNITEGLEDCDDGRNGDDTDLCDDDCHWTYCGDNIRQNPNGRGIGGPANDGDEDCDGESDCTATCEYGGSTICGNNIPEGSEDCDDGPGGSEQCTPSCHWTRCGDGTKQNPNGERTGGPANDGDEDCDEGSSGNDFCTGNCEKICKEIDKSTFMDIAFDIDLYPLVTSVFGTPERLLGQSHVGADDVDLATAPNAVLVTPDPGFIGWDTVNTTLDDGSEDATICFNFTVKNITHYVMDAPEPTRLLVAKGKMVSGFYEKHLTGNITSWGPYIITVKIWEKKR